MSLQESILVLNSSDLDDDGRFALADPPPTGMTIKVDTRFLDLSVQSINNETKVYLSKYLLDCVWRDADDPSEKLTANSGTSVSKFIKVYLYAGDPANSETVRLIQVQPFRDGTVDEPDFFIYRDQAMIYEKAHNPYHPNQDLSSDLYFENQYTQQTEGFVNPGLYLGKMNPQALMALKRTMQITIKWHTDRPNFPSPFWHERFLRGCSVWNPVTQEFEVRAPGEKNVVYYKNVGIAGVTWAPFPTLQMPKAYTMVALSENGKCIIAADENGHLSISIDQGGTWETMAVSNGSAKVWKFVSVVEDGAFLAIAASNVAYLKVYDSANDSWGPWQPAASSYSWGKLHPVTLEIVGGSQNFVDVAMSTDTQHVIGAIPSGALYKRTDPSNAFQALPNAGEHEWTSVAISNDGARLLAARADGIVMVSADGGDTWTSSPSSVGNYVCLSGDGTHAVAAESGGGLSISADGGVTWSLLLNAPQNVMWTHVECNAAFTSLVASTSSNTGSPKEFDGFV